MDQSQSVTDINNTRIDLKIAYLSCEKCNEAFQFKNELLHHNKHVCQNLACYVDHPNLCAPIVKCCDDLESATNYMITNFPAKYYKQGRAERSIQKCKLPGCTSTARIKSGKRYDKNGQLVRVFIVLACTYHNHDDNNTVQEQKSLEMPVKKLKLEVLSKFLVTNNVKDQNDFSLAYAEEKVAKPEVKYFNFSLEQMKSFSQRFQGKTYDSNQKIISSISGNDLELSTRLNNGIYKNCKDYLCPYETRIRECHPTELHAKLRAKALDPYGFMTLRNQGRNEPYYDSKCQNENCHATLMYCDLICWAAWS